MNPTAVVAAIESVLQTIVALTPIVIQAGKDLTPFAEAIYGLMSGTNVTAVQLATLQAQVQALSDRLQVPLPVDDGTTTE
jgi:hypothetical protein